MQIAQENASAAPALGVSIPESGTPARGPYADYKIIRRNGAVVAFEPSKISVAMTKAFLAVNGSQSAASARVRELVGGLTDAVVGALMRRLSRITPHAEADAVLRALREATIARRAAGSLAGRDGLAARAGLPPGRGPVESWPPEPRWSAYLPELFPAQEATASLQ